MQAATDLAETFERHRIRLQSLARRLLGNPADAEEVVQESWIKISKSLPNDVANAGAWLTTVVTNLCIDRLRARQRRLAGTIQLRDQADLPDLRSVTREDPERQIILAQRIGLAMLVVLERLKPAERVAFILHDVFELPFDEIAPLIATSAASARQLASRARHRVYCAKETAQPHRAEHYKLAERFLTAARTQDVGQLLALLVPDITLDSDAEAAKLGPGEKITGAAAVAAFFAKQGARAVEPAVIDGEIALVVAPEGNLLLVLQPVFLQGRIAHLKAVALPQTLGNLDIQLLAGVP